MDYVENLKNEMIEKGLSNNYIHKCTSYAEKIYNNNLPVIFDSRHMSKLMGVKHSVLSYYIFNSNLFYSEFTIMKKSGQNRTILAPSLNLKKIQRWILDNILISFPVSKYATGFKKKTSIVDNAKLHVNKTLVYSIDIEDFFPSITAKNVYFLFYNVGYSSGISYALTKLLTYSGILPQGSPCSPAISNILCRKMDESIGDIAYQIAGDYSRYADDMTISVNDVSALLSKVSTIKKVIEYHGFRLNNKKERMQYNNQTQQVTGLIVNNDVKVRLAYKKDVEKHIYFCEKFGIYSHLEKIGMKDKSFFKEYLFGKVYFINSVEPEVARAFLDRLNKLNWAY